MDTFINKNSTIYFKAIAALFLGSIVSYGSEYCLQPILPIIANEFNVSPSAASLVMSLCIGGMSVSMFFIAGIAGSLDRRKSMFISIFLATLCGFIIAFSNNFNMVLFMRLLQGVILAAFPALSMAYISEEFDPAIVGQVIGMYLGGCSFGAVICRFILSTLTDFFPWRTGMYAISFLFLIFSICFYFALPHSQNHIAQKKISWDFVNGVSGILKNKRILQIFIIAFILMGSFVAVYNFITFPLLEPPYNLSQTQIGALFTVYFIGSFSSAYMGWLTDKYGNGKILLLAVGIMFIGATITLPTFLLSKIIGLAIFTFGYFGAHSTAFSWTGRICKTDKAQTSAIYLLFYYAGGSILGSAGGIMLNKYGWNGMVLVFMSLMVLAFFMVLDLDKRQKYSL